MKLMAALMAMVALTACSRWTVNTDWDQSIDFSGLQRYVLLDNTSADVSPFAKQRIEAAIVATLGARGLQQVSADSESDIAVGFEIATEDRTTYQTVHSGFGTSGFRHNRSHWGVGVSTSTSRTTQQTYTVGSLIIAVFEQNERNLIWEGSASGNVDASTSQDEAQIAAAVEGIFKNFPPAP